MHSPNFIMHPYIGALLFGVSPIRCACIIKYRAVLKFFQQPFFELAATLKNLGAKWLSEKKITTW